MEEEITKTSKEEKNGGMVAIRGAGVGEIVISKGRVMTGVASEGRERGTDAGRQIGCVKQGKQDIAGRAAGRGGACGVMRQGSRGSSTLLRLPCWQRGCFCGVPSVAQRVLIMAS